MIDNKLGQLSDELNKSEQITEQCLEDYYTSLADIESRTDEERKKLYNDVKTDIEAIKKFSSELRDTYMKTLKYADELNTRMHETESSHKKSFLISRTPANSEIDYQEEKKKHFANGRNLYKILLVCFFGSFFGVVIELIWCFITRGYLESRSGLVYGPFNMLYGIGAVGFTFVLYRYRNRSSLICFAGGMLVGSAVEYVCSFAQELIFGTRSWDYSNMPFNLNGRICLLYSVFWGFLGVLWIKKIYPRFSKALLRVPNEIGKTVTWVVLAFFVINSAVTAVSLSRWMKRTEGLAPSNTIEQIIDDRFPDERMEKIFANMKIEEKFPE